MASCVALAFESKFIALINFSIIFIDFVMLYLNTLKGLPSGRITFPYCSLRRTAADP